MIAIMSETYGIVMSNTDDSDNYQLNSFILEFESMMFGAKEEVGSDNFYFWYKYSSMNYEPSNVIAQIINAVLPPLFKTKNGLKNITESIRRVEFDAKATDSQLRTKFEETHLRQE